MKLNQMALVKMRDNSENCVALKRRKVGHEIIEVLRQCSILKKLKKTV